LKNLPDLKHNFLNFYWDYNNNFLKVIRLSISSSISLYFTFVRLSSCVRWSFRVKSPQKINKIKKHDVPDLYCSLHRIRFYLEYCLQFQQQSKHIILKCLADIGTGITDVIGGPHDFLPPRSDRSDEFQKLWFTHYTHSLIAMWDVYPTKFSVEILYKHYNLQVFVIIELVYNNNVIVE
jgi:hypothetical protein